MGVFLLIGFKKTNKQTKKTTRTTTQLCAKQASKLTWNNYFNVYLYHTYKWQRILNHCDIDGISYCRILLLINTRTFTNATTFSVENRLLGNEKSGRGFALSDADTLPQSHQASLSWIFAPFSDTSFQSARLNFFHWNNTEKNCTFSLFETSVKMATWRLHTLWRFTFTALSTCPPNGWFSVFPVGWSKSGAKKYGIRNNSFLVGMPPCAVDIHTHSLLYCLRRESNFLASTRPVTALCVCVCCIIWA